MIRHPIIQQLADIEKLEKLLSAPNPHATLRQWAETAGEIDPNNRSAIQNTLSIYAEMADKELNLDRLLSFIEAILEKLSSVEDRQLLITAQAIGARKSAA